MLGRALDDGFVHFHALVRDPWFDDVRRSTEFATILKRAESRLRKMMELFVAAHGPELLGLRRCGPLNVSTTASRDLDKEFLSESS